VTTKGVLILVGRIIVVYVHIIVNVVSRRVFFIIIIVITIVITIVLIAAGRESIIIPSRILSFTI
jgi:hypothetical protein